MPLSINDVAQLVKIVVDNKITYLEYDGVKIQKGIHELPKDAKQPKKVTDEEILFNPTAGLDD